MIHPGIHFVGHSNESDFLLALGVIRGAREKLEAHLRRRAEDGQKITLFMPSGHALETFCAGSRSQLLLEQVITYRSGYTLQGGLLIDRNGPEISVSSHT